MPKIYPNSLGQDKINLDIYIPSFPHPHLTITFESAHYFVDDKISAAFDSKSCQFFFLLNHIYVKILPVETSLHSPLAMYYDYCLSSGYCWQIEQNKQNAVSRSYFHNDILLVYQGQSKHQVVCFTPVTKVDQLIMIFWDLFGAI